MASFLDCFTSFAMTGLWITLSCHCEEWNDEAIQKLLYLYNYKQEKRHIIYWVTNNLIRRIYEHKNKLVEGFSKKYSLDKLVYYEQYSTIEDAILREKQIKGGSRKKKLDLINNFNKEWKDLYEIII